MRSDHSLFEQAGIASGLLNEEQLDHAWQVLVESLPAEDLSLEEITDQQLADRLVKLNYLNRWQVEQLLKGRTKFTLGSYRIVDAIGHGGMGWVFKGEHILLGRIEAIKVLPRNQMDATSIANFLREIRSQAQLDHPNLVRLSYADKDGDTYFLVTEYVDGSDMRRLVHYHGAITQRKAAALVSQAAEALHYAHGKGLVHRDVKPGNLLITAQGITKLTDLGLASFSTEHDQSTKPKHIVGTADFLAPENIVSPHLVRSVSDIYSLGCTLYYAVTGKVPFPGGDTADKLRRQLDEVPIAPQRLNPELDDDFVEVISQLMQKRPEDRVSTASEVVELLKPWTVEAENETWETVAMVARTEKSQPIDQMTVDDTIPFAKANPGNPLPTPPQPGPAASPVPPIVEVPKIQPGERTERGVSQTLVMLMILAFGFAITAIGVVIASS